MYFAIYLPGPIKWTALFQPDCGLYILTFLTCESGDLILDISIRVESNLLVRAYRFDRLTGLFVDPKMTSLEPKDILSDIVHTKYEIITQIVSVTR